MSELEPAPDCPVCAARGDAEQVIRRDPPHWYTAPGELERDVWWCARCDTVLAATLEGDRRSV